MCRPCSSTTRLRRQYSPKVTTHHLDVCLHADCLAAGKNQTVRRARPLALRRAMTLRPFLVLMRFRNPCSRLRLRFEGCLKVNDIAHSFSRGHFSMKRSHYRGVMEGCQSKYHRVWAEKLSNRNPQHTDLAPSLDMQIPTSHPFLRHSCPIAAKMPQQTASYSTNIHHN
jgi:hypothetical protein